MELIKYREATFNVIRLITCNRINFRDEANNYLHTHWDILVEVHWHPVFAAYTSLGLFQPPVAAPGTLPGATDLALLSRLLQPRGLLTIIGGGSVILQTPGLINPGVDGQRYACDVKGGPTVEAVNATQMVGTKDWFVTLHIIADVRDITPGFPFSSNAVISNTWAGEEAIDYQRRSTRRFAGRAILRADVLRLANINANNLRDLYVFPCPNHYQRMNLSVRISEDGTICDYSFEDVMRGYDLGDGINHQWPNSTIQDIECYETASTYRGSPGKLVLDIIRGLVNAGSAGGMVFAPMAAIIDNLPKAYQHCRCDLTADRNANLGSLTAIALGVCNARLAGGIGQILTGTMEIIVRRDIADKVYTSVEVSTQYTDDNAIEQTLLAQGGAVNAGVEAIFGMSRNWRNQSERLGANLDIASDLMINIMKTDSRLLTMKVQAAQNGGQAAVGGVRAANPLFPDVVIASRQGDFQNNPPLRQGAYGVVPQNIVGAIPPQTLTFNAAPIGAIPFNIEHLIVQALLGQNQTPPVAATLRFDS